MGCREEVTRVHESKRPVKAAVLVFVPVLRSLPMESVSYLVLWRGANPLGSSSSNMSSFSLCRCSRIHSKGSARVMLCL